MPTNLWVTTPTSFPRLDFVRGTEKNRLGKLENLNNNLRIAPHRNPLLSLLGKNKLFSVKFSLIRFHV